MSTTEVKAPTDISIGHLDWDSEVPCYGCEYFNIYPPKQAFWLGRLLGHTDHNPTIEPFCDEHINFRGHCGSCGAHGVTLEVVGRL